MIQVNDFHLAISENTPLYIWTSFSKIWFGCRKFLEKICSLAFQILFQACAHHFFLLLKMFTPKKIRHNHIKAIMHIRLKIIPIGSVVTEILSARETERNAYNVLLIYMYNINHIFHD